MSAGGCGGCGGDEEEEEEEEGGESWHRVVVVVESYSRVRCEELGEFGFIFCMERDWGLGLGSYYDIAMRVDCIVSGWPCGLGGREAHTTETFVCAGERDYLDNWILSAIGSQLFIKSVHN